MGLTNEQIKEMLKDKKTLSDLKKIGYMRDEIWLLHRRIERIEPREDAVNGYPKEARP